MNYVTSIELYTFDPIKIAGKLRELGDDYEEKVIKPLMNNLKYVPAHQAAAAFGEGVTFLCQSHVAQRPGVAPEMQLIQASVAFGLYVRKASPDLREKVQDAMVAFLNSRVGSWVAQQGGWDVVTGV
ncbi:bcl-2-like protein 15 [Aplochiton taeniatus]